MHDSFSYIGLLFLIKNQIIKLNQQLNLENCMHFVLPSDAATEISTRITIEKIILVVL